MNSANVVHPVAVKALTTATQIKSNDIAISAASYAQIAAVHELSAEDGVGGLRGDDALNAACRPAPQVVHFQFLVGCARDYVPRGRTHSQKVDSTAGDHTRLDRLTGSHVDHIKFAIALTRRQHQVVRLLVVTIQADLAHGRSVALQLEERVGSIDVPEGETADTVTRDGERIAPSELHHSVSMSIEQTLYAF